MPLSLPPLRLSLKNRSPIYLATILLFTSLLLLLLLVFSNRSLPFSVNSNTLSLLPPPPISAIGGGVSIKSGRSQPPDPSLLPPPPQVPPRPTISKIEPVAKPDPATGDIGDGVPSRIDHLGLLKNGPSPPPTTPPQEPGPMSEIKPAISETEAEAIAIAGPKPAAIGENVKCNLYDGRWEKDEEGRYPLYAPGSCPFVDDAFTCQENGRPDGDYTKWKWRENVKCNLYEGRWEKDEEGRYPLYAPGSCPFVDDAFTCQENGRPDGDYTKWRWKPNDCELPRFNATDFLERLSGKSLMLVGDSMNRNQFESILCLLREALPDKSKVYETQGHEVSKGRGYFNFLFEDYNCTVQFIRSHFLARQGTHVNGQGNRNPILEIDRIDKSAKRWKKANILVFNTGHWWNHGKTSKGKNYFKEGGVVYPQFDALEAFKRALKTWGKWIDENINHKETLVFYRGYSAAHFRGGDWDSGGSCKGEIEPALTGSIIDSYPVKMKIVDEVISEMKSPVVVLNVTKLTNFRKDGHPSIYGGKRVAPGQKVSGRKQDCSHWCLPGVPDTWNELIYATLVSRPP